MFQARKLDIELTLGNLIPDCEKACRVSSAMNFPAESETTDVLCTRPENRSLKS
jgi:hypothetical protein